MFKYIKSALFVFTILAVLVNVSFSQNGKALTLKECIDIGLKNNSSFKIAAYQVDRAGANVKGSYSSVLPRITSSFSSGRNTVGETTNLINSQVFDLATVIDTEGNPIAIPLQQLLNSFH